MGQWQAKPATDPLFSLNAHLELAEAREARPAYVGVGRAAATALPVLKIEGDPRVAGRVERQRRSVVSIPERCRTGRDWRGGRCSDCDESVMCLRVEFS